MKTSTFILILIVASSIFCPQFIFTQNLVWQQLATAQRSVIVDGISKDSIIIARNLSGGFRSNDNGTTWQQILNNIPFCRVNHFLQTPTSWLVFADSVYRSTDNGLTWQSYSKGQTSTTTLFKNKIYASDGSNRIQVSQDDGISWQLFSILPVLQIQKLGSFNDRLIALCRSEQYQNVLLQSFNGTVWMPIVIPNVKDDITNFAIDSIGLYTYLDRKGYFLSLDTGKTWNSINTNLPDSLLNTYSRTLFPLQRLLFSIMRNSLYYYSDQTKQWKQLENDDIRFATDIFSPDNKTLFVSTIRGAFRSTDTGKTWQAVYSGLKILSNPRPTSILGKLYLSSPEHFWLQMSSDNGQTWSDTRWVSQGIGTIDNSTVLGQTIVGISGLGGYVSASQDNGNTWRLVIDQVQNIYSARSLVAHNNRLFVIGSSDRLYQSSDTGRTWSINQAIPGLYIYSIRVIDNQLFVSAESGFLRSQDTGKTWVVVSREAFYGIDVLNNQTYIGTALRQSLDPLVSSYRITRDGGMTWENLSMPQGETILQRVVLFRNSVIAQFGNSLYISQDLARTWKKITNIGLTNEDISGLTVHNALLFASFSCSGLYRTDLTTVSTREEPPIQTFRSSPAPNPTSEAADITFTLPRPAQVRLALYSALGTEVWRSEVASYSAGEQRISVETRTLPTGVYAYRLTADGVQSVGRVVVVR